MRVFGTLNAISKLVYMEKKRELENQTLVVATPSQVMNSIFAEYERLKNGSKSGQT